MKGVKSQKIDYINKNLYRYTGRNGSGWQNGIEIWRINEMGDRLHLTPINSKNQTANCEIVIPKLHLQEFINKLQTFL